MYNDTKYSNTPRGAQDKQPLALTHSELPWTLLTIKHEATQTNQFSIACGLVRVTPVICKDKDNEYPIKK